MVHTENEDTRKQHVLEARQKRDGQKFQPLTPKADAVVGVPTTEVAERVSVGGHAPALSDPASASHNAASRTTAPSFRQMWVRATVV